MTDLFNNKPSRPAYLQPVEMKSLSPFQRALLTIDGTVTKFIEAYQLEEVEVVCLSQSISPVGDEHSWLNIKSGKPITVREVLIKGQTTETLYAYAVTLIAEDALDNDVTKGLSSEGASIGRLLRESRMETYRHVLWDGKRKMENLPDEIKHLNGTEFLSRTYRIISQGKPIMIITENFPLEN